MKINIVISWGCQLPGDPLQLKVSNNYIFTWIKIIMPFLCLLPSSVSKNKAPCWIKIGQSQSNIFHPLHSGQHVMAVQTLSNLRNFWKIKSRN